jgi:hypothetical protein
MDIEHGREASIDKNSCQGHRWSATPVISACADRVVRAASGNPWVGMYADRLAGHIRLALTRSATAADVSAPPT